MGIDYWFWVTEIFLILEVSAHIFWTYVAVETK